ncbi:MAG: hypothetical protein WBB67_08170 [bacterium]
MKDQATTVEDEVLDVARTVTVSKIPDYARNDTSPIELLEKYV